MQAQTIRAAQELSAPFMALLVAPQLRTLSQQLFGGACESVRVNIPRRLLPGAHERWFRGPELLVTCSQVPEDGARSAALLLPYAVALWLVERVLGGGAQLRVAPPASPLGEAECGVVAYAAARVLAALELPWAIRDVRCAARHELSAELAGGVLWPFVLGGALGPLEGRLWLSEASARASSAAFTLELSVEDTTRPLELEALEPGDALVSDTLSLTQTVHGLCGPVHVGVRGASERLSGRLDRSGAQVYPLAHVPAEPDVVRWLLATRRVDLWTLACIAEGEPAAFGASLGEHVMLERQGVRLGEGRLISVRGALGLLLTRCESGASQALPRA